MNQLPEWIGSLSSVSAAVRAAAARELFRAGVALSDPIVYSWCVEPAMAPLLMRPEPSKQFLGVTVGVAVTPARFRLIRLAVGSPPLADVPPDQDAIEFELHFQPDIRLGILTTIDPVGPGAIARFLSRQGEGIQQVEYQTTDVDRVTALLRDSCGQPPVYSTTRKGAGGTRINFFLVANSEGKKVLIELVELTKT
jgi:hypothetical protein